jgi:ketosteroid isomerase-like protein
VSQENVEIVRQVMDAVNARDRERALSLMDPEIEFHSGAEQKVYRGIDGMIQYRRDTDAVIEGIQTEDDRFLDAGGGLVVHLYRIRGRGAGSGAPVSRNSAVVWQLRDGKIVKGHVCLDPAEALEAAGLQG